MVCLSNYYFGASYALFQYLFFIFLFIPQLSVKRQYFDDFASLLNHPKSLVRNRVLYILAANAQWDDENRFDAILNDYLAHVIDEKPITARKCIKALAQVAKSKPQYIPKIIDYLHSADLSKYKDSMRPLIEQDIAETEKALTLYEKAN